MRCQDLEIHENKNGSENHSIIGEELSQICLIGACVSWNIELDLSKLMYSLKQLSEEKKKKKESFYQNVNKRIQLFKAMKFTH